MLLAYLGARMFSARCTASSDEKDTTCEILIAGMFSKWNEYDAQWVVG